MTWSWLDFYGFSLVEFETLAVPKSLFCRIYSATLSSNMYLTERPRRKKRRANVELTSFGTQFVMMCMRCLYLDNKSDWKIKFSGLPPVRLITAMPCFTRIASIWIFYLNKKTRFCKITIYVGFFSKKNLLYVHLHLSKGLVLQMIPFDRRHIRVWFLHRFLCTGQCAVVASSVS